MESREETRARLRDLLGAKKMKRNMPPTLVNSRHPSQLKEVLMNTHREFAITQAKVQELGGEILNAPRLHT